MGQKSWLTPTQLADLAEAALKLGQSQLAEQLLAAAYGEADGAATDGLDRLVAAACRAAAADTRRATLSDMQKILLGIT